MKIVFDVETNGLLDTLTMMHCIVARDVDSNKEWVADASTGYDEILDILTNADLLIAHNLIGFDLPAIRKIFKNFKPKGKYFDTLVMVRAMWHDIIIKDFVRVKVGSFPARLKGSHSLEAYGYRLKEFKGDYGKQEHAWDVYNPEMLSYCKQDVVVLKKLYERIIKAGPSQKMIHLENNFATIIQNQMEGGVEFNEKKAIELMLRIRAEKDVIYKELKILFPVRVIPKDLGKVHTSKINNKKKHITKEAQFCKITRQEFNPNSRQQIADRLMIKYGWSPNDVTDKGTIKINETILNTLEYPEAKLLSKGMLFVKRLGQIADGNQAWLKHVKKGRIYARINTGGAISGRCTHSKPNLSQVPSINSEFGEECRELFTVKEGYKMVGCDASGLELRCLAHYLAKFDNGKYADIVLNGDIHTANQQAAGLSNRSQAKTFIYAWLYGAGPIKIGSIVNGGAKEGQRLQAKFMKKFPAVKKLKEGVQEAIKHRGYIKGLDGRRMRTRSQHSALNLLLQGAAALIMKRALIECDRMATKANLNYCFILNCHDEWQAEVVEEDAKEFAKISERSIQLAGEYFKFRIPTDGEAKIGNTWKDTH